MFAIVNLQICKVTTTVLRGEWTFLHVDVVILLFLLGINICSPTNSNTTSSNIIAILIIERAIRNIV